MMLISILKTCKEFIVKKYHLSQGEPGIFLPIGTSAFSIHWGT